jgi:MFS family permease
MAFGLLSIFLPLYLVSALHGTLTDLGIMIAVANFAAVPFSFFWGYLCDKTRHYRLFILMSFAVMSLLFYAFSLTSSIPLLILIYGLIAVFHVAHEAPKNVLIAEYYTREDWEHSFASYEALTDVGWLIGLVLGVVFYAIGLANVWFILLVSLLNGVAFVFSLLFIHDPVFIFERRLVAMERFFDFAHKGFAIAFRSLDGFKVRESLKSESVTLFCAGLLLFSLATSLLWTPLPLFFSRAFQSVGFGIGMAGSLVFAVFIFNTFGNAVGYILAGNRAEIMDEPRAVRRSILVRVVVTLLLILVAISTSFLVLPFAVLILLVMGLAYGFFWISSLSISMELIPEGKAGAFYALVGLGGAFGCFLGTFVAQSYGFPVLFVMSSIVFLLSYVAFKTYA